MGKTEVIYNITVVDFPNICRICLSKNNLKLFDNSDLLDLFKNITNIQMVPDDNLPQNICIDCSNQLKSISSFINLSISSDKKLSQILIENKFEVYIEGSAGSDHGAVEPPEFLNEYLHGIDKVKLYLKLETPENKLTIKSSQSTLEDVKDDYSEESSEGKQVDGEEINTNFTHLNLMNNSVKSSKCKLCRETFSTQKQLSLHQKKNGNCGTKKYKCMDCEKTFFAKHRLNLHMKSHTRETIFECKICLKKFRHNKNLKRHDDIVHKGLKPFKCDVCGKDFATSLRRTEHLRVHTGERPHICTYCGMGFKKYSTRYAHEIRHKIKNGEIPKSDKTPKKYPRKIPDDPTELECDICKKSFSSKQARWVHAQIHNGEKSFLCNVCGKGFLRKNHLEVHARIHTGEKPYKCNDCGKSFRQASSYRSHIFSHKGERSYKCEICLKTFIQVGHLKSHLNTHTGEKPYKCTFCGKGFSQNVNLKSHTRIHTGERPYQCFICYMGFNDSTSLKKHKKTHGVIEEK